MTSHRLPKWLDIGLHVLLGGVFLVSGWVKASHPELLIAHFTYRLSWFPDMLAQPATYGLAGIELALGTALVTRYRANLIRPAAAILLGIFVVYLLIGLFMGVQTPCQCYGQLIQPSPILSLGFDILLLGGLALLERRGGSSNDTTPFVVTAMFVLVFAALGRFTATFDKLLVQTRPGFELPTLPSLHPEALNRHHERLVLMVNRPVSPTVLKQLQAQFPTHQLVILQTRPMPTMATPGILQFPFKPELTSSFVKTFPTCFTISSQNIERVWYGQLPSH